jgi:hypothetical protein
MTSLRLYPAGHVTHPHPHFGGEKTIFNTPVDLAFGRGKKELAPNTIHSDVFSLLSPIFASAL